MKIEFGGGENPKRPNYIQVDVRKINDNTLKRWRINLTSHRK